MRAISWLLILAAFAVGMAIAARYNDGYVLLVLAPWRVELSLNLFAVVILGAFFVGHGLLLAVRHTLNLPRSIAEFRQQRRLEKAAAGLQKAQRLLTEGRYGHAMRSAEQTWPEHPEAGMVALIGWRAAHALRDETQIGIWRQRVRNGGQSTAVAGWMTEAELAIEERRFDDALAALDQLSQRGGRHIAALRLQLKAEQGRGNWRETARLVRQLEKVHAFTPDQAAPLRQRALRECLRGLRDDLSGLQRFWRGLDERDRINPALALAAATALSAAGDCREAQRIIEDALEEHWDSALVLAYGETGCVSADVLGRIAQGEKWLQQHPRDEALLLTLGRLCRAQKLWGKARSFLEASLAVKPTRIAHLELACLLEELGEPGPAQSHYRSAALLG